MDNGEMYVVLLEGRMFENYEGGDDVMLEENGEAFYGEER